MTTVSLSCEGRCALRGLLNRNLQGDTLQGVASAIERGVGTNGHKCRQVEAGKLVTSVTAEAVEGCLFKAVYKVGK